MTRNFNLQGNDKLDMKYKNTNACASMHILQ